MVARIECSLLRPTTRSLYDNTTRKYKYIYDHSFFLDSVRRFFPSRPQYAILGSGNLGQIPLFERHLRGAAQTPLALPNLFHTWPGSGTCVVWAVYARAILASWHVQSLNEKNVQENIYFQVRTISKLASYFVPTTLSSWSHLEAFGLLCTSYD